MNEGEAAELIVNEAREILQNDLGIAVNWNDKNATSPLGNETNAESRKTFRRLSKCLKSYIRLVSRVLNSYGKLCLWS